MTYGGSDHLPEDITFFNLHPVASKEKSAMKYRNMNKYGFHSDNCSLYTTDRKTQCNAECTLVAKQSELINLIKKSSKLKHHHNECNSIGHSKARTNSASKKQNVRKELKRALVKLSRMKSKENTFNEVLALMSQNELEIAYKVLKRYGDNPDKLLDMTKKILEHNYKPNLGDEDSKLIKKI